MTQLRFDDLIRDERIKEMAASGRYWTARCFGWQMLVEADTKREAKQIGDRSVDGFGAERGVDRCTVTRATEDDIAWTIAMGGVT